MKKITFLFLVLYTASLFGQEKKYQSLLWEISGNGLQKKSYVYGSMHVSDKISYHLSDAFFTHLQNADIIANESEPRTWTTLFDLFSFYKQYASRGPFYTNFYLTPLEKDDLYSLFRSSNYNLVSLLSRTDEANKEYQEETYLDMFIYRTGRKFNKKTVGLEDVKKSTINIMKAQANMDQKEVDKNRQAILKVLKNKSYNEALTDFYREKDLDMIDSLTQLSSPQIYLKALLLDRNIEMVHNMDSIMKTGSLFSAVGAAHLPGKKGIIELLRQKGYTVQAVFDAYTDKGKKAKKQIEEFFIKPELTIKTTADGMLSLPLFEIVLENGENLESPDLANGGFINVKRTLLKDFLNKKNHPFNPKILDSLFYENIPGTILEKKAYRENNYWVYDIKNKTKTGNAQHYKYFITPLEIITVIMGGEGEYVRKFEEAVFSKISLKTGQDSWESIVPKKGNFEVEFPSYYVYTGNKDNGKDTADMSIFGTDAHQNAHYFLLEKTLQEIDNLENSEYELKRIHKEFYTQYELDTTRTHFDKNRFVFSSHAKFEDKDIALQAHLKGNKYYLLGTINASEANTQRFFNSFAIRPFSTTPSQRTFTDTTAHFSIEIPKEQNEHLDFAVDKDYAVGLKKKNHFVSKSKNYQFLGSNGSIIELAYYKYHRYESEKCIDSIWNNYRAKITKKTKEPTAENTPPYEASVGTTTPEYKFIDYHNSDWDRILFGRKKDSELTIQSEKIREDKATNSHIYEALVSKPNAHQAIKYQLIISNNSVYELKTLVPKNYKNDDPFVEKTFHSIKINPKNEATIFENKLDLFLSDVRSKHDSIRYSALKSVYNLKFDEKEVPKVITFLNNFKFNTDETEISGALFEKIGRIKSANTIAYLEKIYKKEHTNTVIQFAVLHALAQQKTKQGYLKIKELLEFDLPISDNEYEISGLFDSFINDLTNSQVLFPEIFQYYSIKEYHEPIVNFTAQLVQANLGNPKKLKSYKKMILTNAKLEFKRLASWKNKQNIKDKEAEDYYEEEEAPITNFLSYAHILQPFKQEKEVQQVFERGSNLDIEDLDIAFLELHLEKNNSVDAKIINKVVQNPKAQFIGYLMLNQLGQKESFQKMEAKDIAAAAIVYSEAVDPKIDSLVFYNHKEIRYNSTKIVYYFFKKITIEEDSYETNKQRITGIAFITENKTPNIKGYYKLTSKTYLEEKEISALQDAMIDESLNDQHKRASYGKLKDQLKNYTNEYEEAY